MFNITKLVINYNFEINSTIDKPFRSVDFLEIYSQTVTTSDFHIVPINSNFQATDENNKSNFESQNFCKSVIMALA